MRGIYFLACLWLCAGVCKAQGETGGADAPGVQLIMDLTDGSRIVGAPSIDRLKIKADYADLEVPLSRMRSVDLKSQPGTARVNLQNNDVVGGKLVATEVVLNTSFGRVTVPLARVTRITVSPAGKNKIWGEGMVLHYTFDDVEGGMVVDDSGAGNDGTLTGATSIKEGKLDGALNFSGGGKGVTLKNTKSLQLQEFTIMLWIKRNNLQETSDNNTSAVLFSYGKDGYGFGIDGNGTLFLCKVGVNAVFTKSTIMDGLFHHIGVTKKGRQVTFYIDGTAYDGGNFDYNFEFKTDPGVGERTDMQVGSFLGVIDELAVFSQPVTDDDVKRIYESQK